MNSKSPIERWGPESGVWVWKYPLNERKYVISADISRGDSNDYSAFHVIDTQESEQVCEFKGKLPPDQFGILLNEVGTRYNKALICPENNTYGFSTIQKLRDLGYPNLHLNDKRYQYAVEIPTSKFGFATSGPSRNAVLTKLEEYLRTGTIKIYSSRILDELRTFVWYGDTPRAQKGFNDDLVMALAIGGSLYDPTITDAKKSSSDIYKAMLGGFGINKSSVVKPLPMFTGNPLVPRQFNPEMGDEFEQDQSSPIHRAISWLYR
jgi:hypothetical protein